MEHPQSEIRNFDKGIVMEKARILIVDDEISIRKALSIILENLNYYAEVAANGVEGFKKIQGGNFDLVITDIKMPEMGGIELLQKIKEYDPEIPVTIITGYGDTQTAVKCLKLGAFNFITKPFQTKEIENVVIKGLNIRESILETKDVYPYLTYNLQFIIPSKLDLVRGLVSKIVEEMHRIGFNREYTAMNIPIAVDEAVVNAIVHGHQCVPDRKVDVKVNIDKEKIKVKVKDTGNGFNVNNISNPTLVNNISKSCGRGIFLINCLMDEVKFNKKGNEIVFVKYNK